MRELHRPTDDIVTAAARRRAAPRRAANATDAALRQPTETRKHGFAPSANTASGRGAGNRRRATARSRTTACVSLSHILLRRRHAGARSTRHGAHPHTAPAQLGNACAIAACGRGRDAQKARSPLSTHWLCLSERPLPGEGAGPGGANDEQRRPLVGAEVGLDAARGTNPRGSAETEHSARVALRRRSRCCSESGTRSSIVANMVHRGEGRPAVASERTGESVGRAKRGRLLASGNSLSCRRPARPCPARAPSSNRRARPRHCPQSRASCPCSGLRRRRRSWDEVRVSANPRAWQRWRRRPRGTHARTAPVEVRVRVAGVKCEHAREVGDRLVVQPNLRRQACNGAYWA